jgi:hypothetical protein
MGGVVHMYMEDICIYLARSHRTGKNPLFSYASIRLLTRNFVYRYPQDPL